MKIAAIVVTFNRKALLRETLRGLLAQNRRVDRIYLVDNASTDGTAEDLKDIINAAGISYHRLAQNTGGAGGFSYGIQLAFNDGFDWFWTMDDDVEPRPNALEIMQKYTYISECINAKKVFTLNNETQYWEQYFDFSTSHLIDLKNASFRNGKPWCSTNVACFEGMLVSRRIIEKIGAPDASYFIYHDDTVFGIKASFWTNVIYLRDAIFDKKIYGYGAVTPMRAYYQTRNTFKLRKDVFQTNFVGHPSRTSTVIFILFMLVNSIKMLRENSKWAILKSIVRGWRDGLKI